MAIPTMNLNSPKSLAHAVRLDNDTLWVDLKDGRTLGVPLAYFPRLLKVTPNQRRKCLISGGGRGIHWDELDEDISVPALLMGVWDRTHSPEEARKNTRTGNRKPRVTV